MEMVATSEVYGMWTLESEAAQIIIIILLEPIGKRCI